MKIQKIIPLLLALVCLLAPVLPVAAWADTEPTVTEAPLRQPGQCGEDMYWEYASGTLTITGTGAMDDYPEGAPWVEDKLLIKKVVIGDGITYIGESAFENFDSLEAVEFGADVYEIGTAAFRSCDKLREIILPKSFKIFGEDSFRSCALMYEIRFKGGMPKFRMNCLWDTTVKLIYPANNPWPLEHIIQLEEAFGMRIEFLCSDGTDPYVTELDLHEATAPTEVTQPETQPEETVPETTAQTVPPTEETVPGTQAPVQTVPPTTQPAPQSVPETTAQTQPAPQPTQPTQPEEPSSGGSGIGFALVMAVLSFFALGAMIFGGLRSRGKYSG